MKSAVIIISLGIIVFSLYMVYQSFPDAINYVENTQKIQQINVELNDGEAGIFDSCMNTYDYEVLIKCNEEYIPRLEIRCGKDTHLDLDFCKNVNFDEFYNTVDERIAELDLENKKISGNSKT